jgi:SNF2 family DNA or RNA helicase
MFSPLEAMPIEEEEREQGESGGECRSLQSTKLRGLLEELGAVKRDSPEEKCLVFCSFTGFLDLAQDRLADLGIKCFRLDGAMSKEEREYDIKGFNSHQGFAVFLLSTKVGGVGLNLTSASRVFLCDPGWNPFIESQAISRAHRMGQKRKVIVKRLLIKSSVEEQVRNLQMKKYDMAMEFLEGKPTAVDSVHSTSLSFDDLKEMFDAREE